MSTTKPIKSQEEARIEMITIRMTKQEKYTITEIAKQYGLSLSDYMRFVSINSKIQIIVKS